MIVASQDIVYAASFKVVPPRVRSVSEKESLVYTQTQAAIHTELLKMSPIESVSHYHMHMSQEPHPHVQQCRLTH